MRQAAPPNGAPPPAPAGPVAAPTMPYQGLQPYAERDAWCFFGRERERTILAANLLAARLTLVYGESGVGKSSVLRAGVVHQLRQQQRSGELAADTPRLLVVYLNQWSGDPVARLRERVGEEVARVVGEAGAEAPPSAGLTEALAAWTARWNLDLLVILDQFEEYFLYHPHEDGPGSFAAELSLAVDRSDLPVNFLLAVREDALAKLDRFKGRIPNLFENYVRIRHLRASRAEAAVVEPLRRLSELSPGEEPWTAEPELVRRVLEGVQVGKVVLSVVGRGVAAETADLPADDPPIETPYLQMVLTRLWAREVQEGSRRLRLRTLEALGGPQRIVRTHLDQALDRLPAEQQQVAAAVFHHLVTPSGSKIGHTAADLANYSGLPEEAVRAVLARLAAPEVRVLRTVAAPPGQGEEPRYEVFHDVLAPAILGWRAHWNARRQAEAAARRQLERRARRWRRGLAMAAVLIAVLVASLAVLSLRAARSERAAEAAEAAQLAAQRQAGRATATAEGASVQAQRSREQAYVARADAACAKGWAEGELLGEPPGRGDPGFAGWLGDRVRVGRETLAQWRRVRPPASMAAEAGEVMDLYEEGLKAYGFAARPPAGSSTEEVRRLLDRGDRIGRQYRRLATRSGFQECNQALAPLAG
jgi:hypothetical protein